MSRTIYLAVFSNGLSPALHAVYIPESDKGQHGKVIYVTGNVATGFWLEFERNYDFKEELRKFQVIPLAQLNGQFIKDTPDPELMTDTIAQDRLESVATTVQLPDHSPNAFHPSALNSQTWMRDYIEKLVAEGFIESSALEVFQNVPRKLPSKAK